MTITRCPTNPSTPSHAQNSSSFLTRIPASTTITPTQFYNGKDSSLSSSLSIYPKNSQSASTRSIIQSSVSPVIASPTRASPQAGYAKQPSISPASQMHMIPAVIQQQLDELLMKQNLNFNGLAANPELLKETLLTYNSMYANAKNAAQMAGTQSLSSSNNQSYPVRNKSVITTSRTSAMDVIDLSASNSPTPRSMSAVAALQLQQATAASVANKRAHSGQYLNGNQSSRAMQSSSSASTRLQQQMQIQNSIAGLNGYGSSAYKVEKSFIENQMVHCINMIPYQPNSDMIIPLSEMRDQFYPNANLDVCKRVMQALEINLYSGTK